MTFEVISLVSFTQTCDLLVLLFNADEFVISLQIYYLHTWFYLIITERPLVVVFPSHFAINSTLAFFCLRSSGALRHFN